MKMNEIKEGTRLFNVKRWDDGKLHIGIVTISKVNVTYTPTGKPRKPTYTAHAENFTRGKKNEVDFDIEPDWYEETATRAVSLSLRNYLHMITIRSTKTPEERMLKDIFGEDPNPNIAATEIADVINELKNYHSLFADAFKIDDEEVQKIEVETSREKRKNDIAIGDAK